MKSATYSAKTICQILDWEPVTLRAWHAAGLPPTTADKRWRGYSFGHALAAVAAKMLNQRCGMTKEQAIGVANECFPLFEQVAAPGFDDNLDSFTLMILDASATRPAYHVFARRGLHVAAIIDGVIAGPEPKSMPLVYSTIDISGLSRWVRGAITATVSGRAEYQEQQDD